MYTLVFYLAIETKYNVTAILGWHDSNSTSNLYVLYIELAHSTKQSRRLVLENFIPVLCSLFSRWKKHFYGLCSWVLGLQNIVSPLCQHATFIQCVKYGNTYPDKSFCLHMGGGGWGLIFYKMFPDFHKFLHFADAQIYAKWDILVFLMYWVVQLSLLWDRNPAKSKKVYIEAPKRIHLPTAYLKRVRVDSIDSRRHNQVFARR